MPLNFGSGLIVEVVPPAIPTVYAAAPPASTATVVPLIGPQGPPGAAGGEPYRHDQLTASAVWTINHNLGRYPSSVMLYSADLSQNYDEFNIQHLSVNSLRISMDTPILGVALLG